MKIEWEEREWEWKTIQKRQGFREKEDKNMTLCAGKGKEARLERGERRRLRKEV